MARSNFWARRLGRELADLRDAAGLNQRQAGAEVNLTQSRMTQIENGTGKGSIRLGDLKTLASHYGASSTTIGRLVQLWENSRKNGWWSTFDLPDWVADYVSLEADADHVHEAQLELVPGLLQTPDYARAVHGQRADYSACEVERRVELRMQRQQRLTAPDPLRLTTVVSEGALRRCQACGDVGQAQLRQITERARWPNVEVLVIPFDVGLHPAMAGMSTLLEFPDDLLPPMVCQEYPASGHLLEDEATVTRTRTLFSELSQPGQALDASDSLALLAKFC